MSAVLTHARINREELAPWRSAGGAAADVVRVSDRKFDRLLPAIGL
jgi:hypothetical protein